MYSMALVKKIGIDLGTANTSVFVPGRGVVINEPSVVAIDKLSNQVLAVGREAKEMIGRTPGDIVVYRPMREGVIADYHITKTILKYFISKAGGTMLFRPDVVISVPAGITSTEQRAIVDAAAEAGAGEVFVVREPILAALGAGIPINSSSGYMIVNVGGGTTETAVISLGGIVVWSSVRIAGDRMDVAISEYLKKKKGLAVGEQTAERIKVTVGSAVQIKNPEEMEVTGIDLASGLPKTIKVTSNEVCDAISKELTDMMAAIKKVLADTPPELAADIMEKGVVISGGGALLKNLEELFFKVTGVTASIAEEALFCVAKGAGVVIDHIDHYKRVMMSKK